MNGHDHAQLHLAAIEEALETLDKSTRGKRRTRAQRRHRDDLYRARAVWTVLVADSDLRQAYKIKPGAPLLVAPTLKIEPLTADDFVRRQIEHAAQLDDLVARWRVYMEGGTQHAWPSFREAMERLAEQVTPLETVQ